MVRQLHASTQAARCRIAVLVAPIVLLAAGCGGERSAETGQGLGPGAGPGGAPQAPPATVAVSPAARGPIATFYRTTATLEPRQQADVLARVAGVVLAIRAEEGDRVAAGEELLRIEEQEYRHRLQQAEAEALRQQARFARVERMVAEQLVSAEEHEGARSDLQSAEASRGLADLELSYTRVTAPFAGHVIRRHVDPGQMVNSGTQLFSLADLSLLRARVHVPAKEFRRIQQDQPVQLVLDASGDTLSGRIALINPVVDPASGTIKVTIDVDRYPPSTRPGDFAVVHIVTDRHADALLVPKVAVLEEKGESLVYVAEGDSVARRRVVTVGFRNDRQTEVQDGLAAGERVVVQGQRALEDGQRIKVVAPRGGATMSAGR